MSLDEEVSTARKKIFRDGYDMSLGEVASLYERGEMVINPEYQRLFRWDEEKKSRFIESVLLNIPFPPIFVFSDENGRWELVDGLQRVSTVLELMGLLRDPEGNLRPRFVCEGTTLLPSLRGAVWPSPEQQDDDTLAPLSLPAQMSVRRSRMRVEILGQETDSMVKYELFQRLNTGGANLSEQEIRNVIVISISKNAFDQIKIMSTDHNFRVLATVGEDREEKQYHAEMVTRFIVLRHVPYINGKDVHDYLDEGIIKISNDIGFDWDAESTIFRTTMERLGAEVGSEAFRKNKRFSLGMFEFIALGLSKRLEAGPALSPENLKKVVADVAGLPEAEKHSGIGVRGTQRLSRFVMPLAERHFAQ